MFDCKRFMECLSAYFDGELDGELRVEFEKHLRFCENARGMVRTFEQTIVLHRRGRAPLPPDVHERLLEAIRRCSEEGE
jgi:anti-sigma factor RsiW